MDQEKKKNSRRKSKKTGKAAAIESVEPESVHTSHKVWLIIKGSGFKKGFQARVEGRLGEVSESRWESPKSVRLLVRIADSIPISKVPDIEEARKSPAVLRIRISSAEEPISVIVIRSPIEGMTVIPAGPFIYGSNEESSGAQPEKELTLPSFACGLREVSNEEYLEFLNYMQEHGDHSLCHPEEGSLKSHVPDAWDSPVLRAPSAPVTGVDWFDAYSYSKWKGWRLPTEEEWEKAARGTEGAAFPWGNQADPTLANAPAQVAGLKPTDSYPEGRSPYGLFNAAGNVWEWTAGEGPEAGQAVVRGGSHRSNIMGCRTFIRHWVDRRTRRSDIGFRCASDL